MQIILFYKPKVMLSYFLTAVKYTLITSLFHFLAHSIHSLHKIDWFLLNFFSCVISFHSRLCSFKICCRCKFATALLRCSAQLTLSLYHRVRFFSSFLRLRAFLSVRLLSWCLLFTYALFHVLFDAIQSSVMHFYDTLKSLLVLQPFAISHTHSLPLSLLFCLWLSPSLQSYWILRATYIYIFPVHSQIENVRPHF